MFPASARRQADFVFVTIHAHEPGNFSEEPPISCLVLLKKIIDEIHRRVLPDDTQGNGLDQAAHPDRSLKKALLGVVLEEGFAEEMTPSQP